MSLSKIIISVAVAVALAVGVVAWWAHQRAEQLAAQSERMVLDILTTEGRVRWQRDSALLAAELGDAAQRASDRDPDGDRGGAGNTALAWSTPHLRRALRRAPELHGARILAADGAVLTGVEASAASGDPVAGAALIEAWRERPDPARPGAAVPDPEAERLHFVHPMELAGRGDTPVYLVTEYSTAPLAAAAADLQRHRRAESRTSLLLLILVGVGAELLAVILVFVYARRVDDGAELPMAPPAADSQGLRAGPALHDMAGELASLLQETAEKSRMDKDLEIVQTVQTTLLPPADPVQRGSLRFAGKLHSAGMCGGDWWTYHDLADGKVLLALGDATGHGASAAMITGAAKAACDLACDLHDDRPSVSEVLHLMNQAVFHAGGQRLLMTCIALIIDPRSGEIEFANAGHNFPWLAHAGTDSVTDTGTEAPAVSTLVARGNCLGHSPGSRFHSARSALQRGDRLLVYTDGVIECENAQRVQYGVRRMRAVIRATPDTDPVVVRDAVIGHALEFAGGVLHDDLTLLVVSYT